jgi:hypothetical protein
MKVCSVFCSDGYSKLDFCCCIGEVGWASNDTGFGRLCVLSQLSHSAAEHTCFCACALAVSYHDGLGGLQLQLTLGESATVQMSCTHHHSAAAIAQPVAHHGVSRAGCRKKQQQLEAATG